SAAFTVNAALLCRPDSDPCAPAYGAPSSVADQLVRSKNGSVNCTVTPMSAPHEASFDNRPCDSGTGVVVDGAVCAIGCTSVRRPLMTELTANQAVLPGASGTVALVVPAGTDSTGVAGKSVDRSGVE